MEKKTSQQFRIDLAEWLKSKGNMQQRKKIVEHFRKLGYTDGQMTGVLQKELGYGEGDRVPIPNVKRIPNKGSVFYEYIESDVENIAQEDERKKISPYEQFKRDFNKFDFQLQKSSIFNIDIRNASVEEIVEWKTALELYDKLKKHLEGASDLNIE